jgi:hypothetical protein
VQLQNLTSGTGIATIGCTIAEPQGLPIVMNAHSGCGTHPDARIALTRALTEVAQVRLVAGNICRTSLEPAGLRRPRRDTMVAIASASTISRVISMPPSTMTSSSSLNECANSALIKSWFRLRTAPSCRLPSAARVPAARPERFGKVRRSGDRSLHSLVRKQLFPDHDDAPLLDQHGRLPYRAGYLFTR